MNAGQKTALVLLAAFALPGFSILVSRGCSSHNRVERRSSDISEPIGTEQHEILEAEHIKDAKPQITFDPLIPVESTVKLDYNRFLPFTSLDPLTVHQLFKQDLDNASDLLSQIEIQTAFYELVQSKFEWMLESSPEACVRFYGTDGLIPSEEEAAAHYERQFIIPFGSAIERIGFPEERFDAAQAQNISRLFPKTISEDELSEVTRPPLDAPLTVFVKVVSLVKVKEREALWLHTQIAGYNSEEQHFVPRWGFYKPLRTPLLDLPQFHPVDGDWEKSNTPN